MKPRTVVTTALAAVLLATPAVLVAQGAFGGPGPGFHRGGPGGPGLHMAQRILTRLGDYLELSDEQRTQIEAIVEAARVEMKPLVEQAMAARRVFRESHDPGTFDEDAFRAAAQQQAKIQVEIKVATARTMHQVLSVLTDAQKQKLEELRGLFGPRGDGPGPRFGHGPHGS